MTMSKRPYLKPVEEIKLTVHLEHILKLLKTHTKQGKAGNLNIHHAVKVEDIMSYNGVDFSECTNGEFKIECLEAWEDLKAANFDMSEFI